MLKKVEPAATVRIRKGRYAVVASRYNSEFVDGMLAAARRVLEEAGVREVEVVRVPGAFEIPVVASALAGRKRPRVEAVICLGVILRGKTSHAQHIGESVSMALMQIQVEHRVPVIHEVLLLENEAQARERCLSVEHNRGAEAAHTALEMASVMGHLVRRRPRPTRSWR